MSPASGKSAAAFDAVGVVEAMEELRGGLAECAGAALRELLERKHLYQSVRAQLNGSLISDSVGEYPRELQAHARLEGEALWQGPWSLFGRQTADYSGRGFPSGAKRVERLRLNAPDVKLYCNASTCRRVEPFNAVDCTDVFRDARLENPVRQMFVFKYVCQSCKGEPTVFLVRRHGLKLTLVGRSPFEHVEVPKVIPRSVESFYSGAVVAHQSNQTLAGNFILRTLVEQWVRSFPPAAAMRAEDALDWYYRHLPTDFKQSSPSLREIYEDLSADIHSADGQEPVFEAAVARLIKHFEGWRYFELVHETFGTSTEVSGQGPGAGETETH